MTADPPSWGPSWMNGRLLETARLLGLMCLEAGGTREGREGLPGVWRFLMSPWGGAPPRKAQSWGAGGLQHESTVPTCLGGQASPVQPHTLTMVLCPQAPAAPGLCPEGEAAARVQDLPPSCPWRAGRQTSRSGHLILLGHVQTAGCLLAHHPNPAQIQGLPGPALRPSGASCQEAQDWKKFVALLSWKLGWRRAQRKRLFLSSQRRSGFSQVGQRQATELVWGPAGAGADPHPRALGQKGAQQVPGRTLHGAQTAWGSPAAWPAFIWPTPQLGPLSPCGAPMLPISPTERLRNRG